MLCAGRNVAVLVCVIGDIDQGAGEEPVKDWLLFTQNISQEIRTHISPIRNDSRSID